MTAAATKPEGARALATLGEAARVRLGASAETAREMLRALAADPSLMVRAAVAMNTAAPLHAHRLLAADADDRVRALLARSLAQLIPDLPRRDRSAIAEHVLTMLTDLVQDEAERVRAAIAEVVREMPQAPRELILRLAQDSAVSVSDPVIRLSPLLGTGDLLALLADAPAPATAVAIARRPDLPASVSDAIVASADSAAITALLANTSAAIREATLDALVSRAAEHGEWHEPLVHRPALSARAARALAEIVTTQLLGTLASRGDLDPEVTQELQRRLHDRARAAAPPGGQEETPEQMLRHAYQLRDAGRLDEATLQAAAERADARRCAVLLAVAAGVNLATVERAASLRSAKGLVSLIWKAGFSTGCAAPVQALLGRLGPAQVLRGGETGAFPLTVDEMRWQIDFLQHIGG